MPQINNNRNDFLKRFYDPEITAYEFLKCFFAFLKKDGKSQIDRDLTQFLYAKKNIPDNARIMECINFKSNGVNYYSDDVEDALFNLQNGGLLGKMNPSFGVIIIKYTDKEINEAIQSVKEEFRAQIENIAKDFE